MANKIELAKVADIAEKAPLTEILDTIETVALLVPGVGNVAAVICKILRVMLKLQPVAAKTMHGIADMKNTNEDSGKFASFIPAGNSNELVSLRTMVEIALEDDELTEDEEAFLLNKAQAAGVDKDLFLMGLHNELKKCKNN